MAGESGSVELHERVATLEAAMKAHAELCRGIKESEQRFRRDMEMRARKMEKMMYVACGVLTAVGIERVISWMVGGPG